MAPELHKRLVDLWKWVAFYDPEGKTYRQFAEEFAAQKGNLADLAWRNDSDPEAHEFFTSILDVMDDRGLSCLDKDLDKLIWGPEPPERWRRSPEEPAPEQLALALKCP